MIKLVRDGWFAVVNGRTVVTADDADRWLRFDRSPMGRLAIKREREAKAFEAEINDGFDSWGF